MTGVTSPCRIAVLSAKGGCGRSTVAINLAYLLAAAGRRVVLVDLAQFGSLALLLQVPQAPGTGLGPVAACLQSAYRDELPDVLENAVLTRRIASAKLHLLAAAVPQRQDDLTVEGVLQVLNLLGESGYDLVIDTSHELSDRLAAALHGATHRLWVLSPDPAAGWHLLQASAVATELCAADLPAGILVNRYHRRSGLRTADLSAAVGLPVWGVLPDLPGQLPLAAHKSVPLLAHRGGPFRRELRKVLRQMAVDLPGPSWFSFLRRREVPTNDKV
jgi:pilus assembly protein CpaE